MLSVNTVLLNILTHPIFFSNKNVNTKCLAVKLQSSRSFSTQVQKILTSVIVPKGIDRKKLARVIGRVHSRGRFRSSDLWVMGPARFRCATLLRIGHTYFRSSFGWLKRKRKFLSSSNSNLNANKGKCSFSNLKLT